MPGWPPSGSWPGGSERELERRGPAARRGVGDIAVLAERRPKGQAKVYAELGIVLTYHPATSSGGVHGRIACTTGRVGGGT